MKMQPVEGVISEAEAKHGGVLVEPLAFFIRLHMEINGLTFRQLADETRVKDPLGKGFSHSYLATLASGRERVSYRVLDLLGREVLGIDPWQIAEYRLALVRALFDEHEVPLDEAVGRLSLDPPM